jgi:hypothetical protein
MMRARRLFSPLSAACLALLSLAACSAAPTDEATGATDSALHGRHHARVDHVLLLSIDGMHQVDLDHFVAANPKSALARLTRRGVTYEEAHVNALDGSPTNPSDSFPGLLALVTGGASPTHGGWYDVSYARDLFAYSAEAPCSGAPGTQVTYDESLEVDNATLWTTGGTPTHDVNVVRTRFDEKNLPYAATRGGCEPVYPHDYIRVNTIFEVAHAAGLHTAWSDKHPAYELVTGPSGGGVDDFFAPEINSDARSLVPAAAAGEDFTTKWTYTKVYDDFKVAAIVNQIHGRWSDDGLAGATDTAGHPGVPAIFGMNFQAVSVAQKDAKSGNGGYLDAAGAPGPEVADAIAHTDASIGSMVDALRERGLLESTLIIVTAKHGQSPIDQKTVSKVDGDAVAAEVDAAAKLAGHIEDDVALYWLADGKTAPAAAAALLHPVAAAADPRAAQVFTTATPGFFEMFGDPAKDPRTPDVIVQPADGTIYSLSKKKFAEHGGFAPDDSHVLLVVSNPRLEARTVHRAVRTKQVAPTVLEALGLRTWSLDAVRIEGTEALPHLEWE